MLVECLSARYMQGIVAWHGTWPQIREVVRKKRDLRVHRNGNQIGLEKLLQKQHFVSFHGHNNTDSGTATSVPIEGASLRNCQQGRRPLRWVCEDRDVQ
jgi:hypothetical protein